MTLWHKMAFAIIVIMVLGAAALFQYYIKSGDTDHSALFVWLGGCVFAVGLCAGFSLFR